jgi:hypothetical protein
MGHNNQRHDDFEERRLAWIETSTRWINFVWSAPMHRTTATAQVEHGVLVLRLDTAEMLSMMAGTSLPARTPLWLSLGKFTMLVSQSDDLPAGTAERWAAHIQRLDADNDVVLFLVSPPDDSGRSFSRLIAIRGKRSPVGEPFQNFVVEVS